MRPFSRLHTWNVTSSLCYPGINFTLCWICGYVLIKKKSKTPWIMLAVVIFQWMISTVHVSLGFTVRIYSLHLSPLLHESSLLPTQRLIYGFIYERNEPGGPAAYFSDISIPGNVAKVFLHTLNVSFLVQPDVCLVAFHRLTFRVVACVDGCWRLCGRLEVSGI